MANLLMLFVGVTTRTSVSRFALGGALPIAWRRGSDRQIMAGRERAAIEAHKKAIRTLKIADAESDRRIALADAAVGPSHIEVPDLREPGAQPVAVNCWIDIEKYISPERNAELYAQYRSKLEERAAARAKFLEDSVGDIDEIINEPSDAELKACDDLTETVPTSLPGLLAMLSYADVAMKRKGGIVASFDEQNLKVLFRSLAKAAKSLARKPAANSPPPAIPQGGAA